VAPIADFEQTLGTDLAHIPELAKAFDAWAARAGVATGDAYHVNLVVEELVTNVIRHGLGIGHPGTISLRVRQSAEQVLDIELRDDAPPFDPFEVPPPSLTADLDERAVGGLGVHFVRAFMDEHRYLREGGHNVVLLQKRLKAPSGDGG
jgi:serine/threonine-protein kinase RsbW/sigma-B regulation protein RsbU (phosphoserine phosphatase)